LAERIVNEGLRRSTCARLSVRDTNLDVFAALERESAVTNQWYAVPGMTPDAAPSPHSLATASGLLLGTLALAMVLGALVGWALGGAGIGLLVGALAGIPLGVFAVYYVYSRLPQR
jgi:hypothetical protein